METIIIRPQSVPRVGYFLSFNRLKSQEKKVGNQERSKLDSNGYNVKESGETVALVDTSENGKHGDDSSTRITPLTLKLC